MLWGTPIHNQKMWFDFIVDKPHRFISIVKCACMVDTKRNMFKIQNEILCQKVGPIVSPILNFQCPECGVKFENKVQLSSHRLKKHGVICNLRSKVSGTFCKCCLKQFFY